MHSSVTLRSFIFILAAIVVSAGKIKIPLQVSASPWTLNHDRNISALNLTVVTWNMAEKAPIESDCSFIKKFRSSDIVVLGIQECEDIRPRRREGHRTRLWRLLQRKMLGKKFQCIGSHKMGGLFISVYCKKSAVSLVEGVQLVDVACGVGNVLTNKGAACVVLRMQNKTIALVNSHLAAHKNYVSMVANRFQFDCCLDNIPLFLDLTSSPSFST